MPCMRGISHLREVSVLRVSIDDGPMDLMLQLGLLSLLDRAIIFGQASLPSPILQKQESNSHVASTVASLRVLILPLHSSVWFRG